MHRWCCCAAAILAAGLAGCARGPLATTTWPEARPLGERLDAFRSPMQPPTDRSDRKTQFPQPTGALTLRDAMAAALLGNPSLARFGYAVRAAEARIVQAGVWANPELGIEVEDFGGTGDLAGTDAAEVTMTLGQTFPLGGDIRQRQRLAARRGSLAGWDYESARIALLAEVTQRFVDVLTAERQVELAQESLTLAEEVEQSIRRRIDAGDAPAVEQSRAAVLMATARIAVRRAERIRDAARVQLALTWGSTSAQFETVAGNLDEVAVLPPLSNLTRLINQNPDVARWAAEIATRQAEAELARAEAIPDITAGLGFRWFNENDEKAFLAGVELELPVFDRRQGDILAARLEAAGARHQKRSAELNVMAALASAYGRLANAHAEVVALRDEALPPAKEAYQAITKAFDRGNLGYLDVLDAERTLIDLRQQHLDALAAYHGAVAEIEGLIGQPLSELRTEPEPDSETPIQESQS